MPLVPDEAKRSLLSLYAGLVESAGEYVEGHLVEPDKKHFPDAYAGDQKSVETFFQRMLSFSPIDEATDYTLAFLDADASGESKGSCSSGGCSSGAGKVGPNLVYDRASNGHYSLAVNVSDVGDPMVLASSFARLVGAMTLEESGQKRSAKVHNGAAAYGEPGMQAEIAAVFSGFGLMLLEGACVYSKSCGGLKSHQATYLSVDELSLLVAVFVRHHDVPAGSVKKHLSTTQSESFGEAMAWVDSNPKIIHSLRTAPAAIASGFFELGEKKSLLGRLFARSEKEIEPPVITARVTEKNKHFAEAKRLVAEALDE